jgi:hypothetical protein
MKAAGWDRYGHRDATMILMAFRQKPIWKRMARAGGGGEGDAGSAPSSEPC